MWLNFQRILAMLFLFASLTACQTASNHYVAPSLQEGRASFEAGNYDVAYRQLLPLAARGRAYAQYAIGYMYYYGKGVDCNRQLAQHWLKRAAKQGHMLARNMLYGMQQSR